VHFYGKFKGLNLDGAVMTNASMKFDILNTRFAINDTIHLAPTGLTFKNMRIADVEGHQGTMNGYLRFQHFKDLSYRFEIQTNNMLVMNTKESPDMPFYGTIYGTGNAMLTGNAAQGLDVNVAMTTDRNTSFTYINGNVASAANSQFIKFVDKTPRRVVRDSVQIDDYDDLLLKRQLSEKEQDTDIRLNILADVTPDATVRIVMDPIAGDYITGKGTGNIRTEFYNKGDVRMFGNYRISQGVYKFSLQEVIRKDFVIKDGSTINFNGALLDANMDIQASYTVNSASLNDLIPDASTVIQQPNVRVNCIMNLSGVLLQPTIKLGIELPNERDEIQSLVRNYISTEEQMNMQILYLLGVGKFYTEDVRRENQNAYVMTSVLSSTLSGQLNNALSRIFETNNWNIGTNLSTGDKGWTDVEFEGILSGQLLNNRLLINGNFGYRDNPLANTNFVGDFEAEWLITRSGDIRLKAYNETNDRYYTKTNLTTQGVGIMYKKDFNKWSDLFFWNKWKLRNKRKRQEDLQQEMKTDSVASEEAKTKKKRER
ncbi:translocation/assembly module TamB domain-containing protein, partial [Bacteroides pyogenes]